MSIKCKDGYCLTEQWKQDIYDRADEVDPSSEMQWQDMAFGYAIAKGCDFDQAEEFIREIQLRGWL